MAKISYALFVSLLLFITAFGWRTASSHRRAGPPSDSLRYPEERHLKNVRQLTFGADNAEAYWSFGGKMISFQSNNREWGLHCDQIFFMLVEGSDLRQGAKPALISTGLGRTTCAFFLPGD